MAVGIFTSMANDELVKAIAALQSDIAVLREENAQLRVARHRRGEEPLTELRSLGAEAADAADAEWQVMTDVLVMRDVLLEMCAQVQTLTTRMQQRLERLGPASQPASPSDAGRANADGPPS